MKAVRIDQLDELLRYFDEGYVVSHDEAYRRFRENHVLPPEDLPADPFSPEYAARYLALYQQISGRTYQVENEASGFDVEAGVYRPFPYFSKSTKLASIHYGLMGQLLGMLDLPEGASILECGVGWGNTTLALAMLGHKVTALDIEERYCEVVRRRAELLKIDNIDLVNDEFLWVERTDRQFDAVIFFESFHHCWDFRRLLDALHRVIKPGGQVYFGAEPINTEFTVPWGMRLDGESLFVARRAGWMELGFHNDFFSELLIRHGWIGRCVAPHFWVASTALRIDASDPALQTQGEKRGGRIHTETAGYAMYGPYWELQKGNYRAEVSLSASTPAEGLVLDVCHDQGRVISVSRDCSPAEQESGKLVADFTLQAPAKGLEVRLQTPSGFVGDIDSLTIYPR